MFITIDRKKNIVLLLYLIAVALFIYFYFLKWKTGTAYGDDLYTFKRHEMLTNFSDKISIPFSFQKYRPVHGLTLHLIIESFQKNSTAYYIFNVGIQAINVFILAMSVDLFLKSPFFSLLFSLLIGISRFSFFNISQLLNGGVLEGLAMTFFLLSLFFIIKAIKNEPSALQKQRWILWSILFANLGMYTHERYIIMPPFIILVIFLSPTLKKLPQRQKIQLALIALASIVVNIAIKKYIYAMPFFMGTGGTNIDFSFSSAATFFAQAILSIFQINTGPEYLTGTQFSSLDMFDKLLVLFLVGSILAVFAIYITRIIKAVISKKKDLQPDFSIFIFLLVLSLLFLLPAVVTIRLEQRWLQASLSCFILMMVIALAHLPLKSNQLKSVTFSLFVVLFLWTDFNYLNKGGNNLYMSNSEKIVSDFEQAIKKGIIRANTSKLYIWEKKRDANTENAIDWCLADGYFFEFYQGKSKKIIFVDSIYQKSYSFPVSSFVHFDKNDEQIVYMTNNNHIVDITNNYLLDSLKSFNAAKTDALATTNRIQYNQEHLIITNDDFNKFYTNGFYENENGIRWTNGNASISFLDDYAVTDSLSIELNTYMPPICKNIIPKIVLTDSNKEDYLPILSKREADKFFFKIYFEQSIILQKIKILSETIEVPPPDIRVLSFPFISLELKK